MSQLAEKARRIGDIRELFPHDGTIRVAKSEANLGGLLSRWRPSSGLLGNLRAEDPKHLAASLVQRDAEGSNHLRRDTLFLAQQTEEQMLRTDIAVVQRSSLAHGQLEHLLRAGCVGKIWPSR